MFYTIVSRNQVLSFVLRYQWPLSTSGPCQALTYWLKSCRSTPTHCSFQKELNASFEIPVILISCIREPLRSWNISGSWLPTASSYTACLTTVAGQLLRTGRCLLSNRFVFRYQWPLSVSDPYQPPLLSCCLALLRRFLHTFAAV